MLWHSVHCRILSQSAVRKCLKCKGRPYLPQGRIWPPQHVHQYVAKYTLAMPHVELFSDEELFAHQYNDRSWRTDNEKLATTCLRLDFLLRSIVWHYETGVSADGLSVCCRRYILRLPKDRIRITSSCPVIHTRDPYVQLILIRIPFKFFFTSLMYSLISYLYLLHQWSVWGEILILRPS